MFFVIAMQDFRGKEDFSSLPSLNMVLMSIMVNLPFLLHQIMFHYLNHKRTVSGMSLGGKQSSLLLAKYLKKIMHNYPV